MPIVCPGANPVALPTVMVVAPAREGTLTEVSGYRSIFDSWTTLPCVDEAIGRLRKPTGWELFVSLKGVELNEVNRILFAR